MAEDTVDKIVLRMQPLDYRLLKLIEQRGPVHHRKITEELGERGKQTLARCKGRGLIVPIRKAKDWYTYDMTDIALNVLKAYEDAQESQKSQQIIT